MMVEPSEYVGFIYEWTNLVNGKKYIGCHKGNIHDGYIGSGVLFNQAVEKYGIQNFSREILEYVFDGQDIFEKELKWLKLFECHLNENYYNISLQSGPGWEHINGCEHVKKKSIKKRLKTLKNKGLTKPIHQYAITGEYIQSFESVREAAAQVYGDPDFRGFNWALKKSGYTCRGYQWSRVKVNHMPNASSEIYQYTLGGKFVRSFDSIEHACDCLNGNSSNICLALSPNGQSAYGFQWSRVKVSQMPDLNKQIFQYTLAGEFVQSFEHMNQAARSLGFENGDKISRCLVEKYPLAHGFQWSKQKVDQMPDNRWKIVQFDKNQKPLKIFDHEDQATAYLGKKNSGCIHGALQGKVPFAYGFIWKYIHEKNLPIGDFIVNTDIK